MSQASTTPMATVSSGKKATGPKCSLVGLECPPSGFASRTAGCFKKGYWDRTLEDRGILFTPAEVDKNARGADDLTYQPYTKVSPEMYGQLNGAFGRPNSNYDGYPGVYYDDSGRYYGYASYGYLNGYYGYLDYPYSGGYGYPYYATPVQNGMGGGYGTVATADMGMTLTGGYGLYGGLMGGGFGLGMGGYGGYGGDAAAMAGTVASVTAIPITATVATVGSGGSGGSAASVGLVVAWASDLASQASDSDSDFRSSDSDSGFPFFGFGGFGFGGFGFNAALGRFGFGKITSHSRTGMFRSTEAAVSPGQKRHSQRQYRHSELDDKPKLEREPIKVNSSRGGSSPASSHAFANPFGRGSNASQAANRSSTGNVRSIERRPCRRGPILVKRHLTESIPTARPYSLEQHVTAGAGARQEGARLSVEVVINSDTLAGQRRCREAALTKAGAGNAMSRGAEWATRRGGNMGRMGSSMGGGSGAMGARRVAAVRPWAEEWEAVPVGCRWAADTAAVCGEVLPWEAQEWGVASAVAWAAWAVDSAGAWVVWAADMSERVAVVDTYRETPESNDPRAEGTQTEGIRVESFRSEWTTPVCVRGQRVILATWIEMAAKGRLGGPVRAGMWSAAVIGTHPVQDDQRVSLQLAADEPPVGVAAGVLDRE